MRYPLALSSHRRVVVIGDASWFARIGHLDPQAERLTLALSSLGERGLAWILDADGAFFPLRWLGPQPPRERTLAQWLGLRRRREVYAIGPARRIGRGELLALLADHHEQFEEAPHTRHLRALLAAQEQPVDRELMRRYFGA